MQPLGPAHCCSAHRCVALAYGQPLPDWRIHPLATACFKNDHRFEAPL